MAPPSGNAKQRSTKMQPTFTKLYTVATQADACEPALTAIQNAANWNELCAHPQINEWAVWLVENVKECAPLYADYNAKRAPLSADYNAKCDTLYADYNAKCAPLDADYEAKCAPLYADYEAKCAPLYADYGAKCAPLYADLIAAIRAKYEI